MGITIGGNDPIKGLVTICEHLASQNLMTSEQFDEIVRKMQSK